jgi:hypothetical protein
MWIRRVLSMLVLGSVLASCTPEPPGKPQAAPGAPASTADAATAAGRGTASADVGERIYNWMKPADAAALFSYLRSNFGNSAPPVAAVAVAQALRQ